MLDVTNYNVQSFKVQKDLKNKVSPIPAFQSPFVPIALNSTVPISNNNIILPNVNPNQIAFGAVQSVPITQIRNAYFVSSTTGSLSISNINYNSGDFIYAQIIVNGSTTVSISDTSSLTWNIKTQNYLVPGSNNMYVWSFYSNQALSSYSSDTITATLGSISASMIIYIISSGVFPNPVISDNAVIGVGSITNPLIINYNSVKSSSIFLVSLYDSSGNNINYIPSSSLIPLATSSSPTSNPNIFATYTNNSFLFDNTFSVYFTPQTPQFNSTIVNSATCLLFYAEISSSTPIIISENGLNSIIQPFVLSQAEQNYNFISAPTGFFAFDSVLKSNGSFYNINYKNLIFNQLGNILFYSSTFNGFFVIQIITSSLPSKISISLTDTNNSFQPGWYIRSFPYPINSSYYFTEIYSSSLMPDSSGTINVIILDIYGNQISSGYIYLYEFY